MYSMYCSPENVSLSAEDCLAMKKDMRNTNYSVYIEKIAVQQKWIFVTLNCQQQAFKKSREKPHNKLQTLILQYCSLEQEEEKGAA